ncbi:MAG: alanine racemase [Pseudomonadota bacterium]|nr:alanine racemase [Pseudomonadota bacterium]
MHRPLRLRLDRAALAANWCWLSARAGTATGAAVKADGYGLGAREAVETLADAGCRDFFVATWDEADRLGSLPAAASLSVLHGVGPDDLPAALASSARPVLNSVEQIARWKQAAPGRPCDLMIDTGINRLGLRVDEVAAADGLVVDTLMSHLACADEDHPLNAIQRQRFRDIADHVPARRRSLANSAGICLGRDYSFDLVRPGLALYGGIPRAEAVGKIVQVAHPETQIVQRRRAMAGETVGYGATFAATRDIELAILNIGYGDGYFRGFAGSGAAVAEGQALPLVGRVSMDLVAIDCSTLPDLREGDWLALAFNLATASAATGLSQYELLTSLGDRFERVWR